MAEQSMMSRSDILTVLFLALGLEEKGMELICLEALTLLNKEVHLGRPLSDEKWAPIADMLRKHPVAVP